MKKATHLLLRSPLLAGESLPSYLVRLANLNGYHTPNMVSQVCQERLSQPDVITSPTQTETYARLAELVKLDVDRLYSAYGQRTMPSSVRIAWPKPAITV